MKLGAVLIFILFAGHVLSETGPGRGPGKASFKFNRTPAKIVKTQTAGQNNVKIVGGTNAAEGEFPYQLSVQTCYGGPCVHNCGATIISATHAVCAAHCFYGQWLSELKCVSGGWNILVNETSQIRHNITKAKIHPLYDPNAGPYDICVFQVFPPFEWSKTVQPLPLPSDGCAGPLVGEVCTNIGWGNTNPNGGYPVVDADVLQKVSMRMVSRTECAADWSEYKDYAPITDDVICFQGIDSSIQQGSCIGDSGGPLVAYDSTINNRPYLAGIVSWGMQPCGQAVYPAIFVNVCYFRDWILNNTDVGRMKANSRASTIDLIDNKIIQ